jgi:3-oxoacyl-[acyl-carrier-protein] synthase III
MSRPVTVVGSGAYLPGEPIPAADIERMLGPLSEAPPRIQKWIASTGTVLRELLDIRHVHYAIDPQTREFTDDNVTMSVHSARQALEAAGMAADEIDLICYGSAHQDQMPTASVRIQEALGIAACDELSIHANCTSAYKALYLAHQLIAAGQNRNALVISSSMSSSELRAEYYNQAKVDKESLFLRWFLSDGAGALVLSGDPGRASRYHVEHTYIESVGGTRPSLMFNHRPAYWLNPRQEYEQALHHLRQNFRNTLGTEVFQEEGGSVFFKGLQRMLRRGAIQVERIKRFQVNLPAKHIAESVAEECTALGIPREALYSRLDELGYCGPPMALIALDCILREERLEPGDRIVSFVTEVSKFMQAGYSIRYDGDA